MDAREIFSKIAAHQVKGMMLHNDLANYFDFLGLMGFKRMQEYRFISETKEMRTIYRYFINHYNMLLENEEVEPEDIIPEAWYKYERQDVSSDAKQEAVKTCIEKWVKWEKETKATLQVMYYELDKLGEAAAADKVMEMIKGVDKELKVADRLHIKLLSVDYDMEVIVLIQDELHEKYKHKTKEVGADIC